MTAAVRGAACMCCCMPLLLRLLHRRRRLLHVYACRQPCRACVRPPETQHCVVSPFLGWKEEKLWNPNVRIGGLFLSKDSERAYEARSVIATAVNSGFFFGTPSFDALWMNKGEARARRAQQGHARMTLGPPTWRRATSPPPPCALQTLRSCCSTLPSPRPQPGYQRTGVRVLQGTEQHDVGSSAWFLRCPSDRGFVLSDRVEFSRHGCSCCHHRCCRKTESARQRQHGVDGAGLGPHQPQLARVCRPASRGGPSAARPAPLLAAHRELLISEQC